jgi:hypothetical protein
MIHGSYQKADEAFDEIKKLPLVSTLKIIEDIDPVDAAAMKGPPCGRTEHPEADGFITPTDEDEDNFDVELTDAPTPSDAPAPSNPNPTMKKKKKKTKASTPSGGASASTSGGASASTSGGTSTEPSGGLPLLPPANGCKNKADTLKLSMLPGGGANSGIPQVHAVGGGRYQRQEG